ncbi:MAG: CCA tRNA nucleotidyltransferase [Nanoarchaeota archaeon]|nr:CCA tRNA nucleotidyltransferase [Nanoarchaeota archaeon]
MQEIFKEVLKRIKPSKEKEQEVKKVVKELLQKIKIKNAKPLLGGSGAKGTWLEGTHDIDIYVKFDPRKYKNEEISKILKKELKRRFKKVETLHGSRDYYQISKKEYTIEIIPILHIKKVEEAQNITDISPFHAIWVKKHKKGDQIRLAKAFCRAQNCYGAESYIQGFSGYVLEILTIHYKSFENLLKNMVKWKGKKRIDPERHGVKLNKAKTHSPLILIDPVQADRNAAAALGRKKYNRLIQAANKFLHNPTEKAFEKKEMTIDKLKKKAEGKKLILLEVKARRGKEDVVGAQLLKALKHLRKQLTIEGFQVYDYNWKWDKKALFWFILDEEELPEFKEHEGPKLKQKKHVEKFKQKNKKFKIYKKRGRIFSKMPRKYRKPEQLIKKLIKDENIKDKISCVKMLRETS